MNAALSFDVRRRVQPGREELRRQLLALVLAFVLVWHTLVVPAHAGSRSPRRFEPDDEGNDGEVRGPTGKARTQTAEDLDWPEYIYP